MAKFWHVDTTASKAEVINVVRNVFFARPSVGTRLKVWSKEAQLQSNLRWKEVRVSGSDVAAEVVSGGLREAVSSSKYGPGSMVGTTIAVSVNDDGGQREAVLQLTAYNTSFGLNQQGDLVKSYAKQLAAALGAGGSSATARR